MIFCSKNCCLGSLQVKLITVSECLCLVKDSAADLVLLPKSTRSKMSIGAKEAGYPVRYIYKQDLRLSMESACNMHISGN